MTTGAALGAAFGAALGASLGASLPALPGCEEWIVSPLSLGTKYSMVLGVSKTQAVDKTGSQNLSKHVPGWWEFKEDILLNRSLAQNSLVLEETNLPKNPGGFEAFSI